MPPGAIEAATGNGTPGERSAGPPPEASRFGRRAIWSLAITVFAIGADATVSTGVVAEMADDLGEPVANIGLVASAYALPTAILGPLFGPFGSARPSVRDSARHAPLHGLGDRHRGLT